jgi:RNA polymerase sigma factor (sigma-70 family)
MPSAQGLLQRLRQTVSEAEANGVSDGELLNRFTVQRDEAAFELLLRRHERLVWTVCRRVLTDGHEIEDAFQATFLVLVRKCGSISKRQSIASWLYQVAYRVALRAHGQRRKRARHEELAEPVGVEQPEDVVAKDDLCCVVDQEISRLPEKYRAPVVLCYLEGRTYEEASRLLGCPKGTLSTRLTRARELLRERLTRRGVALPFGLAGFLTCQCAASTGPGQTLIHSTLRAALAFASGQPALAVVTSSHATSLAKGVLQSMLLTTFKQVTTAVLMMGFLGTGLVLLVQQVGIAGLCEMSHRDKRAEPGRPAPVQAEAVTPQGEKREEMKRVVREMIADLSDDVLGNRLNAIEWLGKNKSRAAVDELIQVIQQRRKHLDTTSDAEMARAALALGRIADRKGLPAVRSACQHLPHWIKGGWGYLYFFDAYHGLALLGHKKEALAELDHLFEQYGGRLEPHARREFALRRKEASHW